MNLFDHSRSNRWLHHSLGVARQLSLNFVILAAILGLALLLGCARPRGEALAPPREENDWLSTARRTIGNAGWREEMDQLKRLLDFQVPAEGRILGEQSRLILRQSFQTLYGLDPSGLSDDELFSATFRVHVLAPDRQLASLTFLGEDEDEWSPYLRPRFRELRENGIITMDDALLLLYSIDTYDVPQAVNFLNFMGFKFADSSADLRARALFVLYVYDGTTTALLTRTVLDGLTTPMERSAMTRLVLSAKRGHPWRDLANELCLPISAFHRPSLRHEILNEWPEDWWKDDDPALQAKLKAFWDYIAEGELLYPD